ncbi:uncharacterized protein [Palaemon carinicauda]|uniref:uncharacterized protein n=1 Tax=Palaemon carinicauda TaxID=392227 RepID=UPI0035B5E7E1
MNHVSHDLGLDYNALADAQRLDPENQACGTSCTPLRWEDVPLHDSNTTYLCDFSTGRPRPWIPALMRRHLFDSIHGLSHHGLSHHSCCSAAQLLKRKFIWHGITRDAKHWVRLYFLTNFQSPLPTSDGHRYLFTVIDRSARCPETILLETATSASTSALLSGLIARFGIPEHITSDRGTAFTCQLWTSLGNLLGITLHQAIAYNLAANGMVERFHRTLKAAVMSPARNRTGLLSFAGSSWD